MTYTRGDKDGRIRLWGSNRVSLGSLDDLPMRGNPFKGSMGKGTYALERVELSVCGSSKVGYLFGQSDDGQTVYFATPGQVRTTKNGMFVVSTHKGRKVPRDEIQDFEVLEFPKAEYRPRRKKPRHRGRRRGSASRGGHRLRLP